MEIFCYKIVQCTGICTLTRGPYFDQKYLFKQWLQGFYVCVYECTYKYRYQFKLHNSSSSCSNKMSLTDALVCVCVLCNFLTFKLYLYYWFRANNKTTTTTMMIINKKNLRVLYWRSAIKTKESVNRWRYRLACNRGKTCWLSAQLRVYHSRPRLQCIQFRVYCIFNLFKLIPMDNGVFVERMIYAFMQEREQSAAATWEIPAETIQ